MPKIILKDGSEFIVDQAILEENILPAQPDEMIQLGKNYFKKSSIEIIHGDDNHEPEYMYSPDEYTGGEYNWTEFTGLPNSNEVLVKKSEALSKVAYQNMLWLFESMKENLPSWVGKDIKNIVEPEEGVLKIELLICLLHLIDRESCNFFESDLDKRNLFMENLIEKSFLLLLKDLELEDNQENRIRSLKTVYYTRDWDYGECKFGFYPGEGFMKDSAVGAMTKVLASVYGVPGAEKGKMFPLMHLSFAMSLRWCNTTSLLEESS